MTKTQAKQRIEKLRTEINHHRHLYHVKDTQKISDAALDSLKHELFELEEQFPELITPGSPTQRVAGTILKGFKKVPHTQRMLSLEDVFTTEEFEKWQTRIQKLVPGKKLEYFAELKLDGFAVSLEYEKGLFVRGSTRGDGRVGEDVTQNLKTIQSIPLKLSKPVNIEVRGEVFMTKKVFNQINKQQEKKGEKTYANPRNLAAGSIRQLDPKLAASRKLVFQAYSIIGDFKQKTHQEEHQIAADLGFRINSLDKHCKNLDQVIDFYESVQKRRDSLAFEIDGLVLMVNDLSLYKRLGIVGKAPRFAVAFKFPAEQTTTVVEDIIVNVGRTGVLTPLALLKPVVVAGSTVSRATLHNMDQIKRLGLKIGDTVILQKAGDVIPEIVAVLPKLRTGKERPFKMPKRCPICNSPVTRAEGEVAYSCANKNCYSQQKEAIFHFVSKKGFDIVSMGPKIVEQLMKAGLIHDAPDLFKLTKGDLEPLERFAEKSSEKIIESIESSKIVPLHRLIFALGIKYIGDENARQLAKILSARSISDFIKKGQKKTLEDWSDVEGFGDKLAQSVYDLFYVEESLETLRSLGDLGVVLTKVAESKTNPKIAGKKFIFTGSLDTMSRDAAKDLVREQGGNIVSAVSAKVDFVVVGDDPGSKAEKAKKLNLKIIDEQALMRLLN